MGREGFNHGPCSSYFNHLTSLLIEYSIFKSSIISRLTMELEVVCLFAAAVAAYLFDFYMLNLLYYRLYMYNRGPYYLLDLHGFFYELSCFLCN